MKLLLSLLFSVAVVLVLASPASAFLAVSIEPENRTVTEGQQAVYTLKVVGDSDAKKLLKITVDGPHLEWLQPTQMLVEVRPQREETAEIILMPLEAGSYVYSVSMSDAIFPKEKTKVGFRLNVLPLPPSLEAGNLELTQEDAVLNIAFDVRARNRDVFPLTVEVRDRGGIIVRQLFSDEPVGGVTRVTKAIGAKGMLAGIYNVEVKLDSIVLKDSFLVEPVHNVVAKTETRKGDSYDEVIVTVKNLGNIVERDYRLQSSMNRDFATGFVTKPLACYETKGTKECEFLLGDIEPGKEKQVTYRLEYWPTTARFITGVIVLSAIAIGLIVEYSMPRVRKKYVTRDKREHNIILEIKNPVRRLKNVVVRDFVSPLASVTDFGSLKPVVKRSDAGTELIWRLGDLSPKDHRMISYTIRPVVLGSLKMPRAHIRYGDEKGTKKVYSSRILIE